MKRRCLTIFAIALSAALQAVPLGTEDEALAALQSATTATDKEAACRRLKETGSVKSVPALKALLADESLAQWAADALATLPAREAGEALLEALPHLPPKPKALVAFALGTRREAAAVKSLTGLLADPDSMLAVAAAKALGRIGDAASLAALRTAKADTLGSIRIAVNDALLACADQRLAAGDAPGADAVYASLRHPSEPEPVRAAAFRGVVLCAGNRKGALLLEALSAGAGVEQTMAVQLARELPGVEITTSLAENLTRMPPLIQTVLLEALRQRGDVAAASQVAKLTRGGDAAVRAAALKALGELGDASHVGLLAELAVHGDGNDRAEARQALLTLHRGDVTAAIVSAIQQGKPEVRIELAQTLGRRMDRGAVASLLRLASSDDGRLGLAAIQALEKLADDSQMAALLDLIVEAKDASCREAAVATFAAVGGRSRKPAEFSRLALGAMGGAATDTRCALLEAAGQLGGAGVTEALRLALKEANADVRAAALRTMADYAGDEVRPDLLKLVQESKAQAERALALQGYWRLVEGLAGRAQEERFAAVQAGLAVSDLPAEKRLGLARLGELQSRPALDAALRYREDAAVRAEAEVACLAIASRLDGADLDAAETALNLLASNAGTERVRAEARSAAAKLDSRKGYLAPWLVSGPYRQAGKEAQQLFDVAFAPEGQGKAEWRALPGSGPAMDLLPVAGGDHCIVYLKTRVFSPKAQPVVLEIGTDDGVKVWVNGTLVHANNAVRGFTAGEDKAQAGLREGWNDFLVKVTQHTAGCAASVRVRGADGKSIPGLRVEAKE